MNMKKDIAIGIDIGGTTIKGGAITSEGNVLSTFSIKVVKDNPQEKTISSLIDAINAYMAKYGYNKDNVLGIGLGVPGAIDSENGIVTYSNNLNWHNLEIVKLIEKGTGLPVKITNDANAATLGEAKFGAGKKYKNIIMLTLGTGIGGGIIIDGKLYEGNLGKGGELGHSLLVLDGEQCTCGRKGCFEAYASATALSRDTKRMMDRHIGSKMWTIANRYGKISARTAFIAESEGDEYAHIVVENYIKYLSEGILNYCNIFRPNAIVLSGGVAEEGEGLFKRVREYCKARNYGFSGTPEVEILPSELGYDSGKIGAAALYFE